MSQQAHLEHVVPRPLVAISTTASADRLGSVIISTLDKIWPVLRGQNVRTGHNVVIYRGRDGTSLIIDVGVEVFGDVAADGELKLIATPSGEVATIAHFGDYSAMQPGYAAIERWCAENQRQKAGVSWEVYGDWEDDPAKRRTDIYFGLEPRRRWDDDERFTGVADARDFAAAADELVVLTRRSGWVAEDPEVHLVPHLRDSGPAGLRLLDISVGDSGVLNVVAEHLPGASRGDIRKQAWVLIGAVAEPLASVREQVMGDQVVFDVVTGMSEVGGQFASHGHTMRITVGSG